MKTIREPDIQALHLLSEHPEGQSLMAIYIHIDEKAGNTKQNTDVRMRKLLKKGYASKHDRLYFITQAGIQEIKRFKEHLAISTLGGAKHLIIIPKHLAVPPAQMPAVLPPSPIQAPLKPAIAPQIRHKRGKTQPSLVVALPYPHQRMHAIRLIAKLYRTSYDRWEQIANALSLPYKAVRDVSPKQYILEWEGIKLKLTRHKLIAYPHEILAPIEVRAAELENKALRDSLASMERFLDKTSLRCQRALDGSLIAKISGWEIAFTDNEVARRLTQKGGLIALAFNRDTGKATLWADRSFSTELEAGEEAIHEKMRKWGQAVQDGLLAPYEDEIATRKQLTQLYGIVKEEHDARVEMHRMDLDLRKDIKYHLDRLDEEMNRIYKGKIEPRQKRLSHWV